jgi:hypothetical protein
MPMVHVFLQIIAYATLISTVLVLIIIVLYYNLEKVVIIVFTADEISGS